MSTLRGASDPLDAAWQATLDQYRAEVWHSGYALVTARTGFVYTVGFSPLGKPELAIAGWDRARAGEILHLVTQLVRPEPPLIGGTFLKVRDVRLKTRVLPSTIVGAYMDVAVDIYGDELVTALQLCWPDAHGNYPDSAAYQRRRQPQTIP